MRNDARPVGENSREHSPVPKDPFPPEGPDRVTHDRQSHIVNRRTEEHVHRKDADTDPTLPTNDSTLKTRI
jgi:hypothetical protein